MCATSGRSGAATAQGSRTFVFAGHTDVVPPGPLDQWTSNPFTPTIRDNKLYGRGAADMKGSIAAMVVAFEEFLASHPDPGVSFAFLLTSDEEGPAVDGTVRVCEALTARGERLDWCVVGEPTAVAQTGDTIKNGRRGTMSGRLSVKGVQGHIAYPQFAKNPIHLLAPALTDLVGIEWDKGNEFFQPTSFQVSNIHAGTGASNVIPGVCVVDFNFRFCTESTPESLQQRLTGVLDRHGLEYTLEWVVGGLPFLTAPGALVRSVKEAVAKRPVSNQSFPLRAAPAMAASSHRFVRRFSNWVRRMLRFTKSTNTSTSPSWKRSRIFTGAC